VTSAKHSEKTFLKAKRIGIFGHVGTKNLGDETIIAAVIQNTRRWFPDAEIRAFTFQPEDTRLRHRIPAFPIRRIDSPPATSEAAAKSNSNPAPRAPWGGRLQAILKKVPVLHPCLRALRDGISFLAGFGKEVAFLAQSRRSLHETDLLLIAGSGQLTDHSGGPWGYPYTFFKWSLLAWLTRTKLAILSVGTSWVDSPLSRFFLKFALSRAEYRSYRDENSRSQIEKWGPRGKILVTPDLAYSLIMPKTEVKVAPSSSAPIVGINPIPFFHETMWHQADKQIYDQYVLTQAKFAARLNRKGYTVVFFPTQLRADPVAVNDIMQALQRTYPELSAYRTVNPPMHSHEDLISVMSEMDFVVAARFHGVLISHLLHKPVLAVSYHAKTADLMAQMGQSQCALDIDACTLQALTDRFLFVESHSQAIAGDLECRVSSRRIALDSQYEQVFGLLQERSALAAASIEPKAWPKEPSNARIDHGS